MGLFDDIIGIANEVSALKEEVTGAITDATQNLTDLQGEAAGAIEEATQGLEDIKNNIQGE